MFCAFFLAFVHMIASTSAKNCLERLMSEMAY